MTGRSTPFTWRTYEADGCSLGAAGVTGPAGSSVGTRPCSAAGSGPEPVGSCPGPVSGPTSCASGVPGASADGSVASAAASGAAGSAGSPAASGAPAGAACSTGNSACSAVNSGASALSAASAGACGASPAASAGSGASGAPTGPGAGSVGPCGASSAAGAGSGAGGCVAHGAGAPPGRVAGAAVRVPLGRQRRRRRTRPTRPGDRRPPPGSSTRRCARRCSGAGSGSGSAGTASAKFHWAVRGDVCPYCEVSGYGCWYGSGCWFGLGPVHAPPVPARVPVGVAAGLLLLALRLHDPAARRRRVSPAAGVSGRIIGGT